MSIYNQDDITTSIPCNDIDVIIDLSGGEFYSFLNLLQKLSSNYQRFEEAVTNIYINSSIYLNPQEVEQLALIQTLSAGWQETYTEVNTIQQDFSANWQQNVEYVNSGVIDAGFF